MFVLELKAIKTFPQSFSRLLDVLQLLFQNLNEPEPGVSALKLILLFLDLKPKLLERSALPPDQKHSVTLFKCFVQIF